MERRLLKKILTTGCNGQLGRALNDYYQDKKSIRLINTDVEEINIIDKEMVLSKVQEIRPDIIINCAAHTGVEACESEEEKAYQLNAIGAKNLSLAAEKVDAVIVHISSDYVYDGCKKEPYIETDTFNPQSVYGKTKLAGEIFVKENARKYFIIRTAWLFGDGKNFVRTMLGLAKKKKEVNVVCDQFGTPTSAKEVVKVIDMLIKTEKYGVYHATCEGSCSWAEFATEIFKLSNLETKVLPVTTEVYSKVVKRPAYSVLKNANLENEFNYHMCDWHSALQTYLLEEKEKNNLMKKQRVLVTGANGYIGRHVVSALLDLGHEVLAADFKFDDIDKRAIQISTPIFSKDENIYELLEKPDVCIHMAWRNGFIHNADSHLLDLPDHYTFIKNMIEGGLPQLAVMGTMHEVGYWEGAIKEDTPTNPISLYGIAKNALRQIVNLLSKDHNVTIQWLRAYYIMGDDLKNNSIFSRIVKLENEGAESFPFNSGKSLYDFISVDELAKQIATASTQKKIQGTINCCTGNPVSLADKVEEFIKKNKFKIRPQYGAFPDRPYDSPGIWGDAAKIKEIKKNTKNKEK